MPPPTITPWKHPSDLLQIRAALYNNTTTTTPPTVDPTLTRRHAIARVAGWKLRGNLPHAIESTALLLDAREHHHAAAAASTAVASQTPSFPRGAPPTSEFCVRAVYAAAVARFVTGFCDMGRARERRGGALAAEGGTGSMWDVARGLGMPGHFVVVRHEATHEEMPSLARLVRTADEALEWLWEVFWARLGEHGGGAAGSEEVKEALRRFRSERKGVLKRGDVRQGEAVVEETYRTCVGVCEGTDMDVRRLTTVLVEERLILPSSRKWDTPFVLLVLTHADSIPRIGSSINGACLIWDPLLTRLSAHFPQGQFFYSFALSLADVIFTSPPVRNPSMDVDTEGLSQWMLHLLELEGPRELQALAETMMQQCCLHPGHWATWIGDSVLGRAQEEFRAEWQALFAACRWSSSTERAPMGSQADGGISDQDVGLADGSKGEMAAHDRPIGWRRAILTPVVPIGVVS